jgi:hypothetical protein
MLELEIAIGPYSSIGLKTCDKKAGYTVHGLYIYAGIPLLLLRNKCSNHWCL